MKKEEGIMKKENGLFTWKRSLAIVLAAAMTAGMMTGCGASKSNESNDTSTHASTSDTMTDGIKNAGGESGTDGAYTAEAPASNSAAADYGYAEEAEAAASTDGEVKREAASDCYDYDDYYDYGYDNDQMPNNEEYHAVDESGFTAASVSPLSTFRRMWIRRRTAICAE